MIFKELVFGIYPKSILLILVACIIYSFLDTLNILIVSKDIKIDTPEFIKIARKENLVAQLLQTILFCLVPNLLFIFIKIITKSIDLGKQKIILLNIFRMEFLTLISLGLFFLLSIGFTLLAFKLKGDSSVQYIKTLEPIMAGSINLKSLLPKDILITVILLFILSIFNFFFELHAKNNTNEIK